MILEATCGSYSSRESARFSAALPAYEIGSEIGRGAYGVVLAARHRKLGRPVAVKQLPPAFGADPAVRSRFVAEAQVLAALDHPHIVDVYDFVERDGMCLLVMERLTGGTLWSRFERKELTPEVSCAVLLGVCAGLHHAHQHGVLHRDVKPENLMFTEDGTVKVTDLGIAKVMRGPSTFASRVGEVVGTPAYISPEQARGDQLTPATDVYQAGTVLFELLSGRLPFPVDCEPATLLYRHVHESPPPLLEVAPDIPAALAAVVDRAIATSPADRYESVEAFGVAIAAAAASAWGGGWLARTNVPTAATGPMLAAALTEPARPANSMRSTLRQDEAQYRADVGQRVPSQVRRRARRSQRGIVVPVAAVVVVLLGAVGVAMSRRATEPHLAAPPAPTIHTPRRSTAPTTSPNLVSLPTPSAGQQAAPPVPDTPDCAHADRTGRCTGASTSVAETLSVVSVDRIPPSISWTGGPAAGGSYSYGFVPAPPTCTTNDIDSGPKQPDDCSVRGYSTAVGSHTLTATAHDNAGNKATATRSYTVSHWTLAGFYQPVGMSGSNITWNAVANGATVPLKFNIHAGETELTDTSRVLSFNPTSIPCPPTMTTTSLTATTTGATSMQYDTTAHQFVQNWQTPTTPGACYAATITTQDGSTLTAYFKLT